MPVPSLTIRKPDDWHVHLRDGAMLEAVALSTAKTFGRAIVMPNLSPPVTTLAAAGRRGDFGRSALLATRAFAARFAREMRGQHPGMIHAGGYSAAMHYLKSAASLGVTAARADGAAAIRRMKEMPTNDPLFGPGQVRADGRKIHPMHLFLVKSPGESRGPWDYFKLLRSLPAGQSFRPMAEGGCALAR
jgi:hypothetical protein